MSLKVDRRRGFLLSEDLAELGFEGDPRAELVRRIVTSRFFVRSPLLSRFLIHICRKMFGGQEHEISEYQIGVEVFQRPKGYRPVEDNIVRNYARQLRKRLTEYFNTEGKAEELRIEIPLGSYIPVFVVQAERLPVAVAAAAEDSPAAGASPSGEEAAAAEGTSLSKTIWRRYLLIAAYSLVLIAATTAACYWYFAPSRPAGLMMELWSSLFRAPLNTYIVPADCGFNILEDAARRQVGLSEYLRGHYQELSASELDDHSKADLHRQEMTSFVDLEVVSWITRLPQVDAHRTVLRFARDMRVDDLKSNNVILLGSVASNPWAEMAQQRMNFRIEYSKDMEQSWVQNSKPRPGEAERYASRWNEPSHTTYAVIGYQPNLSGNGHLFLIEGLDVAGTQAAAEALLHGDKLTKILESASRKNGEFRSFEVLLQIASIESNSATADVVASRIEN